MTEIQVGIHEGPETTRILATAGPETLLLKARLRSGPSHPRARLEIQVEHALTAAGKAEAHLLELDRAPA